jgi:GT2 family glycosyltransferase
MTPTISIIIPLFNHLTHTQAMLASLRGSIPPGLAFEIILIDDFSTDGTRAWLATLADEPHIKTLLNPRNLGYAKTNNTAAVVATGDILALLNNDVLLQPGWLEPMLAALQDPALNAGVVGNLQWTVAEGQLDHAGIAFSPQGKFEHIRVPPAAAASSGLGQIRRVLAVTGACCLIRKSDFDSVGGFDEAFVNGGEDVDLCFKLRQVGKRAYVESNSAVRHHVSLSRDRADPQNEHNSRRLFTKWRKEIKTELAGVWLALLQKQDPLQLAQYLDGEISAPHLAKPHAFSRVMAESVLQQEECYWARTLDGEDINAGLLERCSVLGLPWSEALGGAVLERTAELRVEGLRSARNIFVCGRTLGGSNGKEAVSITLFANGMQHKTSVVHAGASFNLGIVAPVVLPGVVNQFTVSTTAPVLVSHFVVDDQVIHT